MAKKDEISYYPEIMRFIKAQIESNFLATQKPLKVYCKTGELKKGLNEIIRENNIASPDIIAFAERTQPLSLDIFALITDGMEYELLIVEVKRLTTMGLAQLSQLIGYCIVSNAQYGILVNVDGGESPRLFSLLQNEPEVTSIKRVLGNGDALEHKFGVMNWDSDVRNLNYTGYGGIPSIPALCNMLASKFGK